MEKLQKDLFKDPQLEAKTIRRAGMQMAPCQTSLNLSYCLTRDGFDITFDSVP